MRVIKMLKWVVWVGCAKKRGERKLALNIETRGAKMKENKLAK
jgi:hypothetical protein